MTTSPAILTSGLVKRFGDRPALDGIDHEAPAAARSGSSAPTAAARRR